MLKEDLTKRKKREAEVISYESVGMFGERKADRDKEGYSKAKKELAYFLQLEKETTDNKLYKNSFEWRFEFPSLLDEFGNFMGFDIVIGNPPYVSNKGVDDSLKNYFGFSDDLYNYFFIKGDRILRDKGILCYITSNTYLTLQSKLNIREQLLRNELLNITNLGHDVFKSAMVSTSIAIYKKNDVKAKTKLIDARGKTKLADAKFYELEQSIFELTPNKVIFIPNEFNLSVHKKYNTKLKWLLDEYWDKISSSTNISKFRDDINRYRNSLNDQDVTLLGLITDGGQGLATANNGFFVGVRNGTKEAERTKISRFIKIKEFNAKNRLNYTIENLSENEIRELFEYLKDKFGRDTFGQGYLYQIVQDEEIADINNLSVNEKIEGIQGTRTFVPYEKGDREGNRWYLVTPYYINWSRKNVAFLKSNSGKKGKGMPVVRNFDFYFKEGFCWSDIHTVMIKSRYKGISVHDVVGMSLFPILDKITAKYLVCIINSQFASEYSYEFLNNTSHFQINDARCLPIIVPSKEQLNDFEDIFDRAFNVQVLKFDNKITNEEAEEKLNLIQLELDKKVNTLYLN